MSRGRCKIWTFLAVAAVSSVAFASCSSDGGPGNSATEIREVSTTRSNGSFLTTLLDEPVDVEQVPSTTINLATTASPSEIVPTTEALSVDAAATTTEVVSPTTDLLITTTATTEITTTTILPPPSTPSWIDSNAESLDLSGQSLTELPRWIGNLSNLKVLNLSSNRLSLLPEEIGNLTNLEILYLGRNRLSILPDTIGNLSNLKILNLVCTALIALPETIENLSNLEELYINNNSRNCEHSNQIGILPDSIGNLNSLRIFNLGGNDLRTLPESFGNLSKLTYLNLNGNKISSLPSSLLNLSSLTEFHFGYNDIGIGDLSGTMQIFINQCCR